MKRLALTFLPALLCFVLCACGNDTEAPGIVGTWEGSGTVSIIGENTPEPSKVTERWTFREDGTATVEITAPDTTLPPVEFTYTLKKGVLTLNANGCSTEFSCELTADTMRLNDTLVFTRVE